MKRPTEANINSDFDAKKPGSSVLKGQATLKMKSDSDMGLQIWCGVWQIDGGQASIQVGDIELHGNKFVTAVNRSTQKAVGPGVTKLHVIDAKQSAYDMCAADMDRDGDLDLVVAGAESNNVVWRENPTR